MKSNTQSFSITLKNFSHFSAFFSGLIWLVKLRIVDQWTTKISNVRYLLTYFLIHRKTASHDCFELDQNLTSFALTVFRNDCFWILYCHDKMTSQIFGLAINGLNFFCLYFECDKVNHISLPTEHSSVPQG